MKQILVTGQVTGLSKQIIKRLIDAGYDVDTAEQIDQDANNEKYGWIINGMMVRPLHQLNAKNEPLRHLVSQLVPLGDCQLPSITHEQVNMALAAWATISNHIQTKHSSIWFRIGSIVFIFRQMRVILEGPHLRNHTVCSTPSPGNEFPAAHAVAACGIAQVHSSGLSLHRPVIFR